MFSDVPDIVNKPLSRPFVAEHAVPPDPAVVVKLELIPEEGVDDRVPMLPVSELLLNEQLPQESATFVIAGEPDPLTSNTQSAVPSECVPEGVV
jgi:hypothetical protein